jgi:hypothetical protein
MSIAIPRLAMLAAFTILVGIPAASAAQNTGDGPQGVTVKDLVDRGFICKPFGDGMLHCSNPDNSVPDWVCYPNQICTPGKPRIAPGGKRNLLAPRSGVTVMQ